MLLILFFLLSNSNIIDCSAEPETAPINVKNVSLVVESVIDEDVTASNVRAISGRIVFIDIVHMVAHTYSVVCIDYDVNFHSFSGVAHARFKF